MKNSIHLLILFFSIKYAYADINTDESTFPTVFVTSNKIKEKSIDVPQSISIIDGDTIASKGIHTIKEITSLVPNMTSTPDYGILFNVRGINSSMQTNTNSMTIMFDGVPESDLIGFDVPLTNIERVEVLRGPQGTMYGKSSIGGVINIITKDPKPYNEVTLGTEYSSWNTGNSDFSITGPINDKVFYGVNFYQSISDGWITNISTGNDNANSSQNIKFHGFLSSKFTDSISAKLSMFHINQNKDWGIYSGLTKEHPISDYKRDMAKIVDVEVPSFRNYEKNAESLILTYKKNNLEITSTTTNQNLSLQSQYDSDWGATPGKNNGLRERNYTKNHEVTSELKMSLDLKNLKYIVGIYADSGKRKQGPYSLDLAVEPYKVQVSDSVSSLKTDTQAIFGQLTYNILKNVDLTVGSRFQRIKKSINLNTYDYTKGDRPTKSKILITDKTWYSFLPKIALLLKNNDEISTYISYSEGYLPGGFNYISSTGTLSENTFDPQKSRNYEIGLKGRNQQFSYNMSIFHTDIDDIQITRIRGFNWITGNAAKAYSNGVEFDFKYNIDERWDLNGSLGFINGKYDKYDAGDNNYDGKRIENTPRYSLMLGINYYRPDGIYANLSLESNGSRMFFNTGMKKFEKVGSYIHSDLKVGYQSSDFDIYAFIKNITDEEHITAYKNNGFVGSASFNDPRSFGIGIRYYL